MGEITLHGYKCERCGHEWVPREEEKPLVCPKCKSPYWDRPKLDPAKRKAILRHFRNKQGEKK
ncbi:MAG: hypothetical protein ACREAF_00700 [Nitrosopumilaceae archaeon]